MIRRFAALALALAAVVAVAGVGAAAGSLEIGVSPLYDVRGVDPANAVEETINVVNLSDEDMHIAVTLTELRINALGALASVEPGTGLPSAASWGKAEPAAFELPRGHVQNVRLTFVPPAQTKPGGYYSAARVVGTTSSGETSPSSIHATLLEVRGADVMPAGKIAALSAPSFSFGSTLPVTVKLQNTGNVYAIATGKLTVRDMRSKITATVDIPKTPVIPGTPRILKIDVPAPAFPGRVKVSARVEFGPGVPDDSASTSILAFAWWHLVSAALVLFVLIRSAMALIRWRRRRRIAKRLEVKREQPRVAAPVAVGDAGLQSAWERSGIEAPAARRQDAPVVMQEAEPQTITEKLEEDFWAPKSDVHAPLRIPAEEPPAVQMPAGDEAEPVTSSVPKLADLMSLSRPADEVEEEAEADEEPRDELAAEVVEPVAEEEPVEEPEPVEELAPPEPIVEAEPVVEPEPEPLPEPAVVIPMVRSREVPDEPAPREEAEPAAARIHKLSEVVRAGVPATKPSGPQAARRRVKVAVDMLQTGSGRSSERLDIAVQLLASAGGNVAGAVEEAFDAAAAAGRGPAMGSLALALALLDSPRAPEALLRSYGVASRSGANALREALKSCDPDVVKAQRELLEALPQDRLASLKLA
jgi:hypothetical protein